MHLLKVLVPLILLGSGSFASRVALDDVPDIVDSVEIDEAQEALDATDEFLETVTKTDPKKMRLFDRVVMYGTSTAYMLASVKELLDIALILSGTSGESEELKFMKKQFAQINNKLDALDYEFRETSLLIDWNTMRVNVGEYEMVIASLERYMNLILNSPSSSRPAFEQMFKMAYTHNADNAPERIYMAAIADVGSSIFQENIFNVARKFYANDLQLLRGFIGFIMRTIQRGLILETTFFSLTNNTGGMLRSRELWQHRFLEMAKAAEKVENALFASWNQQYREDVDKFILKNAESMTNGQLSYEIHEMLRKKFTWRSWFVLTYSHDDNDASRYYHNCAEYMRENVGGKAVIVNSRLLNDTVPDYRKVFEKVRFISGTYPFDKVAKSIYEKEDHFSCDEFRFKGVIYSQLEPKVVALSFFYRESFTYAIGNIPPIQKYDLFVFA